jgi:hypothetical protein
MHVLCRTPHSILSHISRLQSSITSANVSDDVCFPYVLGATALFPVSFCVLFVLQCSALLEAVGVLAVLSSGRVVQSLDRVTAGKKASNNSHPALGPKPHCKGNLV